MILSKRIRSLCLSVSAAALIVVGGHTVMAQDNVNSATSLRDAIAVGLATNPEYGGVAASKRATDEELIQGKALFLPSVDLNGDIGFERSDDSGTGTLGGDEEEDLIRRDIGVTLTQMLFDGWESHYEVKRQQARVTSSAHRVRETAELVGLAIVESYLEVLRQRQLLHIARENVKSHVSIMSQIDDGIKAGRSTRADGAQARARLAAARATEASTLESLRIAQAQYRNEVGDSAGNLQLPVVPFEALEDDVDQEVLQALSYSPTLEIFTSDIEVARAEAEGTKSTQYPQLDLQLNARTGADIGGTDDDDTSGSALVTLNWNLYRGGADVARAREFAHRHQVVKESRAEAVRAVENDVRQTWASMISSGERAAQFAAQANANVDVVNAYKDQFSLNRRTLLDVLDAQNELFVSRSNTVNSEFLEMLAVYRLLGLKGDLLPSLEVEYPRESTIANKDTWSYKEQQKAR